MRTRWQRASAGELMLVLLFHTLMGLVLIFAEQYLFGCVLFVSAGVSLFRLYRSGDGDRQT